MNRREFYLAYARENHTSQRYAKQVCSSVLDTLGRCIVNEDRVYIIGLGTFKKKKLKPRKVGNLHGEGAITIPEKEKIVFEASENIGAKSVVDEEDYYE